MGVYQCTLFTMHMTYVRERSDGSLVAQAFREWFACEFFHAVASPIHSFLICFSTWVTRLYTKHVQLIMMDRYRCTWCSYKRVKGRSHTVHVVFVLALRRSAFIDICPYIVRPHFVVRYN